LAICSFNIYKAYKNGFYSDVLLRRKFCFIHLQINLFSMPVDKGLIIKVQVGYKLAHYKHDDFILVSLEM
jgi:hypothetical protein